MGVLFIYNDILLELRLFQLFGESVREVLLVLVWLSFAAVMLDPVYNVVAKDPRLLSIE
jgi:hypothetical protein